MSLKIMLIRWSQLSFKFKPLKIADSVSDSSQNQCAI
jgi:hypothetical protein